MTLGPPAATPEQNVIDDVTVTTRVRTNIVPELVIVVLFHKRK